MTDDRPRERRRVGFRTPAAPREAAQPPPPDTSFMMLLDADAERIGARSAAPDPHHPEHQNSRFPMLSARELAGMADKSLQRANEFGARAVKGVKGAASLAGPAAKRVGRMPSLATLTGFGGKRAPVDGGDQNPDDPDDPDQSRMSSGANPLRRKQEPESRKVYINDEAKNAHFPTNYVSTTKYSLLTCVPHFLFEQFSRFSNAYFLIVGIGYCIDEVSPVSTFGRYSTLWVLAIVIMISGIKEGMEDYHRYREDRRVNHARTHVVGGVGSDETWQSVHVGDILRIEDREHLPADIVLVASSNEEGLAYIETKQLDGESNLKVKVIPQSISPAFNKESTALLTKGFIECEAPNDRLYKFKGRVTLTDVPPTVSDASFNDDEKDTSAGVPLNEAVALGPENIMIRGSSLRNTDWVMGIVVNTGRDTKLMQNVKPRPRKNSRLERETNRHFFLSLLLQVIVVLGLTVRAAQLCNRLDDAWYLYGTSNCAAHDKLFRMITFFITFSALIPISLYVSMEIVRVFQVYFIVNDKDIYDKESGIRTEVRTSNLNEELGVVHHVFTDKTGTLTANRMEFKKCSISGRVYDTEEDHNEEAGATSLTKLRDALQGGSNSSSGAGFDAEELEQADVALRLLAICHSVVAESPEGDEGSDNNTEVSSGSSNTRRRRLRRRRHRSDSRPDRSDPSVRSSKGRNPSSLNSGSAPGGSSQDENHRLTSSLNSNAGSEFIKYQASSPDEAALVQAARKQGYTYISRSNRDTVIDVFGTLEKHELLETIEFDSTRKRMSVITKDPSGRIRIYTKGADAIIFARLAPGQSYAATEQHLHEFAVEGLRTLCLAYADLDEEWFLNWHRRYRAAASEIENREVAVEAVVNEIECNLTLLGATAIEDKLQDGVPDTLRKLEQAGVKIWVLTGDKQETAINIGLSCGAIDEGMDVVIINEDNVEDTAAQIDRALGRWSAMLSSKDTEKKLGLVIDGQTLHYALEPQLQRKLIVVARMARTVIACRVSPKQKTEIVELVRRHEKDQVTLAIGDGANDVGMIQAAHVGVGIVGLEGQEAKLASDFSIAQFRFLGKLMLVHGRWSYKRLAKMVLYTIYKNATLTLCELYWASYSAFTGQPLLDPWMGGLYNVALCALPPVVLGIFDQELSGEYALAFPEIYMKGQRNSAYSFRVFMSWMLSALWQSAVIFYVCYWGFGDYPTRNGQVLGLFAFGTVVFSVCILNVHAMLLVYQSSWTKLSAALFIVSVLAWYLIGPLFSYRAIALQAKLSPPLYAVVHRVFAEPRYWFVLFLTPVLTVSPTLLWKYSKRRRRPNLKMLVQEMLRSGKTREDITGEPQKPLHRMPSYDPGRASTPTGPVTFVVKGEREYQFSGFNFDVGDQDTVLQHAYYASRGRGARRRRMRQLRRTRSDTDVDVEGVKTAQEDSPDYMMQVTGEWVRGHAAQVNQLPSLQLTNTAALQRGNQYDVDRDTSMFHASEFPGSPPVPGANPPTPRHRRAISDGAVLREDRYNRLDGYEGGDEEEH